MSDDAAARPVFSTTDTRARVTWPAADQPTSGVVVRVLVCVLLWAVAAGPLGARLFGAALPSPLEDASPTWWIAGGIVAGFLALWSAVTLWERARARFGQSRVAALLTQSAVTAGIAVGTAAVVIYVVGADDRSARELLTSSDVSSAAVQLTLAAAVGAGVWWAIATALLPSAFRHAARRRSELDDLRRNGVDRPGVLRTVTFANSWHHDEPEFTVVVSVDGCELQAYMRTTPERVPVAGSRVVVRTGSTAAALIALDPAVAPVFETSTTRFEAPVG